MAWPAAPVATAVAVTGALKTIRLVLVWIEPSAAVYVKRCVDVLLVNDTPTADDVFVTTPPPCVLNTTPPGTVETATSPGAVEGAISTVVGAGTVDAVSCDETASDTTGATLVDVCAAAAVEPASVVVLLPCRFAMYTNLLAITGLVECMCSTAARSLLNTPSLKFGDRLCSTECNTPLSILSSSSESLSQFTIESSLWCGAAETSVDVKRVARKSALRIPNIVNLVDTICSASVIVDDVQ